MPVLSTGDTLYWVDVQLPTSSGQMWIGQTYTSTSSGTWINPSTIGSSTVRYVPYGWEPPPGFEPWGQQDPSWEQQVRQEIMENEVGLRRIRERLAQPHVRSSQIQAEVKARDLLLASLTPDQRASLLRERWFVVEGKNGRRYRVRDLGHVVGNIDVVERDLLGHERVLHRLCGHIGDDFVPLSDHLLAQKLMLEADEDAFLRLANRQVTMRGENDAG